VPPVVTGALNRGRQVPARVTGARERERWSWDVARDAGMTSETRTVANEPRPQRLARYGAASLAPPRLSPDQLFKYS